MKPIVSVSSSDILGTMQMVATLRVPAHVVLVVRLRLWLAVLLVRVAGFVGGVQLMIDCDD